MPPVQTSFMQRETKRKCVCVRKGDRKGFSAPNYSPPQTKQYIVQSSVRSQESNLSDDWRNTWRMMFDFWHSTFHVFRVLRSKITRTQHYQTAYTIPEDPPTTTDTLTQSHNKQTCGSVFKGIPCIDPAYQHLNNGAERERDKACLYCFLSFVSVNGATVCVLSNNSDSLD